MFAASYDDRDFVALEDFPDASYPGEIPPYSYLIDRTSVEPLRRTPGGAGLGYRLPDGRSIEEWIDAAPQPLMPILSYGSLASPARGLWQRFGEQAEGVVCFNGVSMSGGGRRAWCRGSSRRWGEKPWTLARSDQPERHLQVMLYPHRLLPKLSASEGRSTGLFYDAVRLLGAEVSLPNGAVWRDPVAFLGAGVGGRAPLLVDREPAWIQHYSTAPSVSGGDDDLSSWLPDHVVIPPALPLHFSLFDADRAPFGVLLDRS